VAPKGGLSPLLRHTDGERGDKYDNHTEKVMPLAKKEGWTDIDMKGDWNTVFLVEKLFGDGFVLERFSFRATAQEEGDIMRKMLAILILSLSIPGLATIKPVSNFDDSDMEDWAKCAFDVRYSAYC
jgi:hypothetical protein